MRGFQLLDDFFRKQIVGQIVCDVPSDLAVCEFNCRRERCDPLADGCVLQPGRSHGQPPAPRLPD